MSVAPKERKVKKTSLFQSGSTVVLKSYRQQIQATRIVESTGGM